MKRFKFLPIVVLLLLNSCVDITSTEGIAEESNTIAAVMESIQSKTSTTEEGCFSWSDGDNIWLETTSGNVIGNLFTGAGTANANFTFGAFIGELTGKAVYPYNAGHSVEGDVLNVVLPASYDLGSSLENTNAPMYGININGTLKFNHLAGVMRFIFKDVPVGVDRFTITVDKKINGTFEADLTNDYPVLRTENTSVEEEKTITLKFDAITSTSDIKVFVPLPLGTYDSLELALYKGDETIWTYSKAVSNTINRKSLKLMPVVSMGGTIDGEIEDGDSDGEQEQIKEVLIECTLMGGGSGTKSIGIDDNGNLYLTGEDFVDVNGVDYPITADGTNRFKVKVPMAESYTVSYPADAVTLMTDGTYIVHMPNEYVGSSFGVFIGTIEEESSTCDLKVINSLIKLDVSAYADWNRLEFKANCGTSLWGNAVLQSDYSVATVNNGESVVMLARNGDDKCVYIPAFPSSVNGITVTVYNDSEEVLIERTSGNTLNLNRGVISYLKL